MSVGFAVSLDVASDFRRPLFVIAFWPCSMFRTGMPKAAIYKHGDSLPPEGNIRLPPRQPWKRPIQAVPKATAVKDPAQGHLWVGVPRALSSQPPRCRVVRKWALSSHRSRLASGLVSILNRRRRQSVRLAMVLMWVRAVTYQPVAAYASWTSSAVLEDSAKVWPKHLTDSQPFRPSNTT